MDAEADAAAAAGEHEPAPSLPHLFGAAEPEPPPAPSLPHLFGATDCDPSIQQEKGLGPFIEDAEDRLRAEELVGVVAVINHEELREDHVLPPQDMLPTADVPDWLSGSKPRRENVADWVEKNPARVKEVEAIYHWQQGDSEVIQKLQQQKPTSRERYDSGRLLVRMLDGVKAFAGRVVEGIASAMSHPEPPDIEHEISDHELEKLHGSIREQAAQAEQERIKQAARKAEQPSAPARRWWSGPSGPGA